MYIIYSADVRMQNFLCWIFFLCKCSDVCPLTPQLLLTSHGVGADLGQKKRGEEQLSDLGDGHVQCLSNDAFRLGP